MREKELYILWGGSHSDSSGACAAPAAAGGLHIVQGGAHTAADRAGWHSSSDKESPCSGGGGRRGLSSNSRGS